MKAHKMKVTVPEHHQVEFRLPEDFPAGPAEVIVLAGSPVERMDDQAQRQMLQALHRLKTRKWTPEEMRILDEFEEFRRQQPVDFSSLAGEER